MGEIPRLPAGVPETLHPARSAEAARPPGTRGAAPAFEALLERLEARAAELEEKSKALSGPAELPGALDAARVSLEEALRLGQDLLEAYHAARRAPEPRP
jgi:hypothetical protein